MPFPRLVLVPDAGRAHNFGGCPRNFPDFKENSWEIMKTHDCSSIFHTNIRMDNLWKKLDFHDFARSISKARRLIEHPKKLYAQIYLIRGCRRCQSRTSRQKVYPERTKMH